MNQKSVTNHSSFKCINLSSALLESLNALLVVLDARGRIECFNPACELKTGYTFDEVRGREVWDILLPAEVRSEVRKVFDNLRKMRQPSEYVNVWRTKSGESLEISWHNSVIEDERGDLHIVALGIDVTSQHRMEETLRRRLADLIKASPAVLYTCEAGGEFRQTYVSENVEEILGYSPDFCLNQPSFWVDRIHPLERDRVLSNVSATVQNPNQVKYSHAYRFRVADGSYRWTRDELNIIRDENGEAREIIGAWIDINEQRVAAIRQQSIEKRFKDLLETTSDWIWEVDAQGRYTFASGNLIEVLGYTPKEILGRTPFDLMAPDEAERIGKIFQYIARDKAPIHDMENWNISKDGKRVCLLTNGVPVLGEQGELLGYRGVDKDITAKKESEEILNRSEKKFRSIVESTTEGFWMIDTRSKNIQEVNDAFCQMLGYRSEEMLGRPLWDFADDQNKQIILQQTAKIPVTDHRVYDLTLTRKDGSELYAQFNATTLRDDAGQAIAAFGFVTDLSEHNRAEKMLIRAKEEADRANRAKSSFLSSMSHELRTPMNAIMGFAQILKYDQNTNLTPKQEQAVDNILKGGRHLMELTNHVLELSKIEAGEMAMNISEFPAEEVINESLLLIRSKADEQGIRLRKECICTTDMPVLKGDMTRVKQVLLNLLSNAVKYNRPDGEVVLTCDMTENSLFRINIRDTGMGIPAEMQPFLFEPFERLDKASGSIEGTGIGLVISKKIIELHEGRIGFESEQGRGSVFWIELPLAKDSTTHVKTESVSIPLRENAAKEDMASSKVLYIEDNPISTQLMELVLEEYLGIEMISASTAREGIELANQSRPDLILMDINLPDLNGIEALSLLKQSENMKVVPVVAVTASAMSKDIDTGIKAGFAAYIIKPIDIQETIHTVSAILEKKKKVIE